jgi:hypothetical protein
MLTRFKSRLKQGQKTKDIMEIPLIMENIASKLYQETEDKSHLLMQTDLNNLKQVFKEKETKHVLDKYMFNVKMDENRVKQFYYVGLTIISKHRKSTTFPERIQTMYDLYNHFVKNKDIINRKQPVIIRLRKDILDKLDRFNVQCPEFKQKYGNTFIKLLKT